VFFVLSGVKVVSLGLSLYGLQMATCSSCLLAPTFQFRVGPIAMKPLRMSCLPKAPPSLCVMYFLISWNCSSWYVFSFYSHIQNNFWDSAFVYSESMCIPPCAVFFFSLPSKQFVHNSSVHCWSLIHHMSWACLHCTMCFLFSLCKFEVPPQ
jgi:hypothetical protein